MTASSPAERGWWGNYETKFGGVPHNLHGLRRTDADESEWSCRCGHHGTAATADLAVAAHQAHVAKATPGRVGTDIYATEETCS